MNEMIITAPAEIGIKLKRVWNGRERILIFKIIKIIKFIFMIGFIILGLGLKRF